jgi:hypothetical protein
MVGHGDEIHPFRFCFFVNLFGIDVGFARADPLEKPLGGMFGKTRVNMEIDFCHDVVFLKKREAMAITINKR